MNGYCSCYKHKITLVYQLNPSQALNDKGSPPSERRTESQSAWLPVLRNNSANYPSEASVLQRFTNMGEGTTASLRIKQGRIQFPFLKLMSILLSRASSVKTAGKSHIWLQNAC